MPCGGCGGGSMVSSGPSLTAEQLFAAEHNMLYVPAAVPDEDAVLIEYYSSEYMSTRTFVGEVTGRKYRFGSDQLDRVRYVLKPDVNKFLGMPDLFRVFEDVEAQAPLAAAGPPKRNK